MSITLREEFPPANEREDEQRRLQKWCSLAFEHARGVLKKHSRVSDVFNNGALAISNFAREPAMEKT